MSGLLILFSSEIERSAAFPDGDPPGVGVAICGVGLVDAAVGAAREIDRVDPDSVLFAGTCGAHRGATLRIGEILLVSEAGLSSGDVARGEMRIPALLPSTIAIDAAANERLARSIDTSDSLPTVRCSCTLGVTESDALADLLEHSHGADVENLELFAVLRAAGPRPALALLGVTNIVGSGGGTDWRRNYAEVMGAIGVVLRVGIERGTGFFSPNVYMKESQ